MPLGLGTHVKPESPVNGLSCCDSTSLLIVFLVTRVPDMWIIATSFKDVPVLPPFSMEGNVPYHHAMLSY